MAAMRLLTLIAGLLCALIPLGGVTLEKLSLDEMIAKSTSIVRGRVVGARVAQRGPMIYTFADLEIIETLKGEPQSQTEVAIPGGTLAGYRQEFSGVPSLRQEFEYVLFLWTGSSGITHVIGLSQGIFVIEVDEDGKVVVHRAASGGLMLDPKTGQPIQDKALTLEFSDLRRRVERTLGPARK